MICVLESTGISRLQVTLTIISETYTVARTEELSTLCVRAFVLINQPLVKEYADSGKTTETTGSMKKKRNKGKKKKKNMTEEKKYKKRQKKVKRRMKYVGEKNRK